MFSHFKFQFQVFWAIFLFVFFAAYASAQTVMRIGMASLPIDRGNPLRSGATPTIYFTPAIFDGLTRIDRKGNLLPWLAVSWEPKDTKTWTVRLRRDVIFSNGTALTAEVASFAINYLASEESLPENLRREIPAFEGAIAVDELTFEVTTKTEEPLLMRSLSILSMVEPNEWTRLGREGFAKTPTGTGPFSIVEWGATSAQMEAASTSWRSPKVDRLEVLAIPDKSARVQALQSNRIDLAIELGPEDGSSMALAGLKAVHWVAAENAGLSFILEQRPESPLKDVRVREALNLAVNRDLLTDVLLEGATVPATQPVPRAAFGYNPDLPPIPYNPTSARALLQDAGYEDGFSMVAYVVGGIGVGASVMQIIANDFAAIGVDLELRSLPIQQFLQYLSQGNWPDDVDAFSMNWPVWPSLDSLRALRLHSCFRREPWFCDKSIMPRIENAMAEWDEALAVSARRSIMAWYRDQYPAVYIFETAQFAGMQPNVTGFSMDNNIISYETLAFTP